MKNLLTFLFVIPLIIACNHEPTQWAVSSPSGNIQAQIFLKDGKPFYNILSGGQTIIDTSALGFAYKGANLSEDLTFDKEMPVKPIEQKYTLKTGKQVEVEETGHAYSIVFKNEAGQALQIDWQVYNTGLAFRYHLAGTAQAVKVEEDLTEFHFSKGGNAWLQPYDTIAKWGPAYERYYNQFKIGDTSPYPAGWCFPALFETANHWLLLSEGGLNDDYVALHLQAEAVNGKYTMRFPEVTELNELDALPTISLPFQTSWKTIAISTDINGIVNSNLVTHVSEPNILKDDSWITPGISSWSWLSDHDSPQNYEEMIPFIDLSADFGWTYFLVDANWNRMQGGNIKQLIDYATNKKVDILMWYNSGGPHNIVTEAPRDIMFDPIFRKQEFAKLKEWGVKGVKIDFFQSDKQEVIKLYHDILRDAAEAQILINFHGCTMPRGWSRTYPHLISMEAVRGAECYSFEKGYELKAPKQNTILPFTRNVVGSMDYTPIIFTERENPHITTYGHELALGVVFESGILHMGDAVEGYQSQDEITKQFLSALPTVWEETRYLQGRPAQDAIIARRKGNTWYIGGINGENKAKEYTISLDFIPNKGNVLLLSDGAAADKIISTQLDGKDAIQVKVLPYGGFVLKTS